MTKIVFMEFRICLYLLLAFGFVSCNEAPVKDSKKQLKVIPIKPDKKHVKLVSSYSNNESDTLINIIHESEKEVVDIELNPCQVHVSYVESYCGGAYPSEEILKEYEKQSPLANTHLVLKNKKGKRFPVKTNAKGVFQETLADGRYSVFMTKNVNPESAIPFDPNCDVWLKSEFAQFTVKANKVLEREIVLYFSCNPCLPPRP